MNINIETVLDAYKNGTQEQRNLLENLVGKNFFK